VSSEIIPLGKYKGQPIEVLAGDPRYADWLRQQGHLNWAVIEPAAVV
jgi:hypothetical protein